MSETEAVGAAGGEDADMSTSTSADKGSRRFEVKKWNAVSALGGLGGCRLWLGCKWR